MSMGESFQFTEEELLAEAQSRVPNPDPAPDPTSSETTPDPVPDPTPDTEVEEETEEETEEELEETSEEEEEETPPVEGYSLTLQDGSTIQVSPEEILAYYQVDQRLKHDKHFAEYLQSYTPPTPGGGGTQAPPPVTTPPPPSVNLDELDLDDPNIKFLYETVQRLEQELNPLREGYARHEQAITSDQEAQANAIISAAQRSFHTQYEHLTEADIKAITDAAARTGMVNTYMQGVHPITGLPVSPNPLEAINLAMETIYWANPVYREQAMADKVKAQREERVKKRKAGALAGPGGSTPRTVPNLKNEKDRREAMLSVVAQDMGLE